jgi:hypothetical protein
MSAPRSNEEDEEKLAKNLRALRCFVVLLLLAA